jgi:hypothetical protein
MMRCSGTTTGQFPQRSRISLFDLKGLLRGYMQQGPKPFGFGPCNLSLADAKINECASESRFG